jgi:hypothetical protein
MSNAPTRDCAAGSTFQTCIWLFLFLLVVRLVRAFVFKRDLSIDDCEIDRVAFALSRHMGLANPFKIPTGPTSHVAPAYPFMLAGIYQLLGKGSPAEVVRQILSCSATCLQFALLPALATAANFSSRVGVLAALVGGLSPLRHWIETKATFETPYTALLLVILSLLTLQMWNLAQLSAGRAWLYGATWGVALLFAPNLLPVLFGYLTLGALRFSGSQFRYHLQFSLTLLLATAIVLTPWTLRNYHAFHHLIFIRGNFGLELSVSNNDSALPLTDDNLHTEGYRNIHPSSSLPAAQVVAQFGETTYYHEQLRTAYGWISAHPWRFLRLTIERVGYFWFTPLQPHAKGNVSSFLTWCVTLTGIAGLFLMLQHHRWPAFAIGVVWLTYPLVYYLLQFDLRYRYPIEWTFLFAASYGVRAFLVRVLPGFLREQMSTQGW